MNHFQLEINQKKSTKKSARIKNSNTSLTAIITDKSKKEGGYLKPQINCTTYTTTHTSQHIAQHIQ